MLYLLQVLCLPVVLGLLEVLCFLGELVLHEVPLLPCSAWLT